MDSLSKLNRSEELKGKRLLLLGGSMWKDAIRQYAEENEIVLIAAGSNTEAAIFDIAQEGYQVNSIDAEAMKALIVEKGIDGVYMGGSEVVISHACQYLNELGMPCYCTKEQWDSLQNKQYFKECLQKHNLPVVPNFSVTPENLEKIALELPYPVITKPTDGCGSNGFSVCYGVEDLIEGYKKAVSSSLTGGCVVEKFVKNDGIVVIYTIIDGKAFFSGIEDKYPVKYPKFNTYVVGMLIFESKMKEEFCQCYDDKIQSMVADLGLKSGSFWIEVFYDGQNYYFNEAGYRYGGSITIYPVVYYYGYNQLAIDIYYSLTGKNKLSGHSSLLKSTLKKGKKYCIYSLHLFPGEIGSVEGIDEVLAMENIVALPFAMKVGHIVPDTGTIAQVFGFVHFVFSSAEEWRSTIKAFLGVLKIKDTEGKNMINIVIDYNNPMLISKSL